MALTTVKGSVWDSEDNNLGVNVKDHGAVGDGVTNDTAAVQAAIDAVSAAGGGDLYFPPGTYLVGTAIAPKTGVNMIGQKGAVTIQASTTMTAVMYSAASVTDVFVSGIIFDADNNVSTGAVQLNEAAYEDITFEDCKFINVTTSWTVLVGYVEGSPGTPGDATSALTTKSSRINFNRCVFKNHVTSTLEQCIIVNTKDSVVTGCTFDEHEANTNALLIYAFCSNIVVTNNFFLNVQDKAVGVQQSDNVIVTQNQFEGETAMAGRFINVINSAKVAVTYNGISGTKASNPMAVAMYSFSGTTFESGNYTSLYQGCYDIVVDKNYIDGCYSITQIPAQSQADKTFIFEGISVTNNNIGNCGGIPVLLGTYTVVDALTQIESMTQIDISHNIIRDYDGNNEGGIYVVGTSTADITDLNVIGNIIPQAATGTNAYGMRLSYIGTTNISNNNVWGKGSREAIKVENEDDVTIIGNDTHGFGVSFGAATIVEVKDNRGCSIIQERHLLRMQNTQGATITAGSVVILKSNVAQNQITMTATGGDYRVIGVVLQDILDTEWGYVVTKGRVTNLKANGTTAIAAGDLLTCYNSNGISAKAAAGNTCFAVAGEAYAVADSAGVLDAIVIPQRQI